MTRKAKLTALFQRNTSDGWALLPLRLIIGYGFAAHGYAKLARGPESFATILAALGLPAPSVTAWVTSLLELVGGAMLMVGAAVIPLSVPLAITMLTAMFMVHFQYGFSSIRLKSIDASGAQFGPVGYEINLLYLGGLLALVLGGAGPWSVDRWLARRSGVRRAEAGSTITT